MTALRHKRNMLPCVLPKIIFKWYKGETCELKAKQSKANKQTSKPTNQPHTKTKTKTKTPYNLKFTSYVKTSRTPSEETYDTTPKCLLLTKVGQDTMRGDAARASALWACSYGT